MDRLQPVSHLFELLDAATNEPSGQLPEKPPALFFFFEQVKANAVLKLAYLQMLGYDMQWASFHIVEGVCSAPSPAPCPSISLSSCCCSEERQIGRN